MKEIIVNNSEEKRIIALVENGELVELYEEYDNIEIFDENSKYKFKDISEQVVEAKKFFAEQVISQIQNYFRTVNIPLQDIRAIVVSGGGSMHSEYIDENGEKIITSEPMSSYITAALKKVCDGVEVVPYEETPRLANIQGLYIRSSLDFKKKAAK